jgi:YD repeat-containing protein
VTDPAGRHLYFNYGPDGVLSSVTSDPGTGINVTYTFAVDDSWSLWVSSGPRRVLTQATQSDNTTLNFAYDGNLNITSVTDTNGKVLESHLYGGMLCNAGLSSSRANGVDALSLLFPNMDSYCSYGGVGYPAAGAQ